MIDILLEEDQNLKITDDLVIGDADDQNVYDILISAKGEYKRTPQIGVDAYSFQNANADIQSIKNIVRLNLEIDNFIVDSVDIINGSIVPICKR